MVFPFWCSSCYGIAEQKNFQNSQSGKESKNSLELDLANHCSEQDPKTVKFRLDPKTVSRIVISLIFASILYYVSGTL